MNEFQKSKKHRCQTRKLAAELKMLKKQRARKVRHTPIDGDVDVVARREKSGREII